MKTAHQKRKFIRELIANVRDDILSKVDQMPEEWDGHELRQYVVDRFEASAGTLKHNLLRLKNYKNEVLVRNL